jgi:hypothetical protein
MTRCGGLGDGRKCHNDVTGVGSGTVRPRRGVKNFVAGVNGFRVSGVVRGTNTRRKAPCMRKFWTFLLAPALTALLAMTGFVAYGGGDGDTAARRPDTTSSDPAIGSRRETTTTSAAPVVMAPAQAVEDSPDPVSPAIAPTPRPSDGGCDATVVHDAIARSDAVGADLTFEITYLKCAEGYGWARILADYGEGATVFLEGSGADIELLNLGSSVCPLNSGIPASVATELAPPGSHWQGECGL